MDFNRYLVKTTKRIEPLLGEGIKDFIYRNTGLFPPDPPMNPPLREMTQAIRKQIKDLHTVCLFLGPNRNLTTLTASILALHPNCQIMSHGGERVLPVEDLNFLKGYSEEKFDKFCHFALAMSQTRGKGGFGGSITITHPFRHHKTIRRAYQRRYGRAMIKPVVKSLVWKEAHLVDNYVEEHSVDLGGLMEKNKKLRFIMPVRNPLQVAYSFFSNDGFRQKFYNYVSPDDVAPIIENVLAKMQRTIELQQSHPERVLIFFEDDIDRKLLVRMAKFLETPVDDRWLADADRCFDVKERTYEIPSTVLSNFKERTKKIFADNPVILERFRQYF